MEYCNIFIAEYQYNQYNNNIIVPSAARYNLACRAISRHLVDGRASHILHCRQLVRNSELYSWITEALPLLHLENPSRLFLELLLSVASLPLPRQDVETNSKPIDKVPSNDSATSAPPSISLSPLASSD